MVEKQELKQASREAAARIFAEVQRSGSSPLSQIRFSKIIEEEVVAVSAKESPRRPRPH